MKIKSITIGELPPEVGPPGERLIMLFDDDSYESILIQLPQSPYRIADSMKLLSRTLEHRMAKSYG